MKNNNQYSCLLAAAKEKLAGTAPEEIARATGFLWDGKSFSSVSLGIPFQISWTDLKISPELDLWHHLTILQYMAGAKDVPITGRYIALSDFREGGLARGGSFDRENDRIIGIIGTSDITRVQKAAGKLGGVIIPGNADISFRFSFLPGFPLVLNLWFGDEDFPASGKVLLDAAAERILQAEAAGTVTGILLAKLQETIETQTESSQ